MLCESFPFFWRTKTNEIIIIIIVLLSQWRDTYHGPQQKCQFECVVEWDPIQHQFHEDLQDTEDGEDHPVDQPLRVVALGLALDGLEGLVRRVDETDQGR